MIAIQELRESQEREEKLSEQVYIFNTHGRVLNCVIVSALVEIFTALRGFVSWTSIMLFSLTMKRHISNLVPLAPSKGFSFYVAPSARHREQINI